MALIKDKKTFVMSVAAIVAIDMGVMDKVFGSPIAMATDLIEYDIATVEGVLPEYNSFKNTANIVTKNGKDTVVIAPVNFNDSISKSVIEANATKFGENEYGDGSIDATMESMLNGVGKLHLNAQVGTKKIAYEALTTFKIAGGYVGKDGKEDIVFPVPAANKEVLDGTTLKLWTNAAATPLVDIARAYDAMKIKPSFMIMNSTTYAWFMNNATVMTADNTSTGKMRNFFPNLNIDGTQDFFLAGKVIYKHVSIDIYVEKGTYKNKAGSTVAYLADGYVVYANSNNGALYYGGIPKATAGGVKNIRAVFDVEEVMTVNPPVDEVIYRTAPLPVLKQAEGFFSQKTF